MLGEGTIRHLLVDRGFVDGPWITKPHNHGTRVTIGVKEDMLVMEEMKNLSRLSDAEWNPVAPRRSTKTRFQSELSWASAICKGSGTTVTHLFLDA